MVLADVCGVNSFIPDPEIRATRRCRRVLGLVWLLSIAAVAGVEATQERAEVESTAAANALEPDFFDADDAILRRLVLEAVENSPSVHEAMARYRAALEKVPQVDTLPDPTFTFTQAIRSVETRVGPQYNSFTLSQAFPWFGELDLKGQVEAQEAVARLQQVAAAQREIVVLVKRAYYELAYVDQAEAITREEQSLLEHYETLAQARYASGDGLQQAVLRIQSEITRVINRLELLARQRSSLQARLNTLLDRHPADPISIGALPPTPELALDAAALYELGDANRPELKASEERIEKSRRAIELSETRSWPDFFVGFGFVNVGRRGDPAGLEMPPPDNGKNAISVSAGVSLPLWRDQYDASVREANEILLAEQSRYAATRNEMEFSIRDQTVRLETLVEQIRLFEEVLIPQAQQTLLAAEAAYETAQLGVLDLLDSERVLLNARLVDVRYKSDLWISLASLERAIGTRFPR